MLMQVQEVLISKEINGWATYAMDISQRIRLGGVCNENIIQVNVKKEHTKDNDQGSIYRINIENRKQTNTDGIRAMEDDLAFLQKELSLQTNPNGAIDKVINLHEIRENWKDYRNDFQKRFKHDESVENVVATIDTLVNNNKLFTHNI